MCKQKNLLEQELVGMWDLKLSVFLIELAQHVRRWHKPRTALSVPWDSTAASSVSPVLPKHILQHHPQQCTCCIISSKCRIFTFFLLLVTTLSNASSRISVHRWANTSPCATPVASPRTSKSCIICTTLWSTFSCQQDERTLQGNTMLGTKLEREKPKS